MTFKVQIDSDNYDRATLLLVAVSSQLSCLSMLYRNKLEELEPSNHILSDSLMGFELTIKQARELLSA